MNGWKGLIDFCREKGITISTAESCTGGYISSLITDVPGPSETFLGGVVAYSNRLKMELLCVNEETLIRYGAVSRETALEMSRGVGNITGSDIGLSVTGIAGPAGGTEDKPVGTVYISICLKDGRDVTEGFLLQGVDRLTFKKEVAKRALGMLSGAASMF